MEIIRTDKYPTRYVAFDNPRCFVINNKIEHRGGYEFAAFRAPIQNSAYPNLTDGTYLVVESYQGKFIVVDCHFTAPNSGRHLNSWDTRRGTMTGVKIQKLPHLYSQLGVKNFPGLERSIYKGTECGAWIAQVKEGRKVVGVKVGSIVEGVDGDGTETHTLLFPFDYGELWDRLDDVEKEADHIWRMTHGCEACPVDPETDYHMIDPDCPVCHGEGVII